MFFINECYVTTTRINKEGGGGGEGGHQQINRGKQYNLFVIMFIIYL